jgi:hypothetical protein
MELKFMETTLLRTSKGTTRIISIICVIVDFNITINI